MRGFERRSNVCMVKEGCSSMVSPCLQKTDNFIFVKIIANIRTPGRYTPWAGTPFYFAKYAALNANRTGTIVPVRLWCF
jgi:hypothetical protein